MRRLLILANPVAGHGRSTRLASELAAELQHRGVSATVYHTTAAGDAGRRARDAGDEGWDGVVAVGGDGTVNEVLNGMPDPTRPIGVLPAGTANVLAMELGLPRDPSALADALACGVTRRIAIGRANGRRFLLFCGVGVDGAIVERVSQVRTGTFGMLRWAGPVIGTLRDWPRYSLSAHFADGTSLSGLSSVLVTRVRNYGGLMQLTPNVDVASGRLHVLCFRAPGRMQVAWQGIRATCRLLRAGPRLEVRDVADVRIEGDAPYQVDGEFGGDGGVQLALDGRDASVFVPATRSAASSPLR